MIFGRMVKGHSWGLKGVYLKEIRSVPKHELIEISINSVQTRCIVKARLRKIHFSGDFLGVFDFLRIACSLGIPQENL